LDRISHTKEILSMRRCPTHPANFTASTGYRPSSRVKPHKIDSCWPLTRIFLHGNYVLHTFFCLAFAA
jgi:hypothetical protein